MSIRRTLSAACAVILAAALAACGSSGGSKDSGTKSGDGVTDVRLAYTPGAPTLQVHIAQEMGFFAQHKLNVKLTEGLDLPTWVAGLDRQWDVAMTTSGIFVTGVDKFNLVGVAGAEVNRQNVLGTPLITRNPSIKRAVDLIGKRVGIVTLTGTTPASLDYLVKKEGGDPNKVKFVQVPFANQADQLKSGKVDAVVSAIPFASTLLKDKANKALFDVPDTALRDIDPQQKQTAFLLFTATRSWADKHKAAVTGLQQSFQQAITWINSHKDAALTEMSKWLGISKNILEAAPWPFPASATVSAGEVQPVVKLYEDRGLIKSSNAPSLQGRFSS